MTRPGCECAHNLIYWRNQPYIGAGPSAAGCIDDRRYKNIADVGGYVRMMASHGHAEAESEHIDRPKLVTEMIMMQFRLAEGLSIADFRARTGCEPADVFGAALSGLVGMGLLTHSASRIALTRRGRLVADAVIAELVSAAAATADLSKPVRPATLGA